MGASKKKSKSESLPLDLSSIKPLEHLQAVPKARSSSITSVESADEPSGYKQVLLPPTIREFDELEQFEAFVRDETWDNEFDYFHGKLHYYPPFVMKECQNNIEKIKPTMNKNSKKFRRNLQHHIQKHLIKDLEKCCGYELSFDKAEVIETPEKLVWKFKDETDHGFSKEEEDLYNRHWKLQLDISCTNDSAMVDVDYRSIPI
ncbi:RGI1 [Candida oxycetoniae]|uniref:Respiratory growth induced protein 1 n=1 Tax=Candida oxycetoniae TaxID=497107 RepID=A0AAI9SZI3_9ASCO|nr:RGI1 [Candida oxycetoniae]KAI3406103.1 RGI1 [Candida oxycetoniae]